MAAFCRGGAALGSRAAVQTVFSSECVQTAVTHTVATCFTLGRGLAWESAMKLLVVEDEALLRHHLQTRLREGGHVVEAVANAEEALYQTGQFNHDLAMIDLGLPGLGGLELIGELRPVARRSRS
jgi:PleD family two-component response regulator